MNLLLNLLWMILGGGAIIALQYAFAGLILCLTVVGIPFGMQCFKMAAFSLFPFGSEIEDGDSGNVSLLLNIIWIVFGGIGLVMTHLTFAITCAVTIIGIPFAIQHAKMARLCLMPFGARIR